MDLALPPMPFSAVAAPIGAAYLVVPEEMRNSASSTEIELPPGVVQVIVTWQGAEGISIRHYRGEQFEVVHAIPSATSGVQRSTGVLALASDDIHRIRISHTSGRGDRWEQETLDKGYVAGIQVMPMGTAADITGGGSLLRVDDSVGTRVFLGDQMIYGDTGWRNVGANGTATWDFSGHGRYGIAMRRVNERVTVWVAGLFDQSTGTTLFSAPDGFVQSSPFAGRAYANAGVARVGSGMYALGAFGNGRDYYLWGGAGIGTGSVIQEFTWETRDRWPTTLPGTAL